MRPLGRGSAHRDAVAASPDTCGMNQMPLVSYVGWALVYAAVIAAGLGGLGLLTGLKAMARALPAAFVILFFVVLSQYPLPEARTLVCPTEGTRPNLMPFAFVGTLLRQWRENSDFENFLRYGSAASTGMNLVICAVIGGLVARYAVRLRAVLLSGFAFSLATEVTQLTGVWGLYPCAYRTFDVDDLLLNTIGVGLGFLLARRLAKGGHESKRREPPIRS